MKNHLQAKRPGLSNITTTRTPNPFLEIGFEQPFGEN